MTPNQMKSVAATLAGSGKLDLNQLLELQTVGMPLGKVGPDGQFMPLTDAERTQFANTPVNYIEKLQGAVDYLKQTGGAANSKSGYADWTGLLTTLQSLQGTPSGVNITA
ncbi:MAG: hypothetical protein GC182_10310 [Rhodopseudomonas sp.]|nr:hypothetical protein [Rhodopseudomonas sp.]